jgi:hypothetical protein
MRHAGKDTYIATIADRDGWVFEHVFDAPSAALAEREMREIGRHWGMTLIEIRRAPTPDLVVPPGSTRREAALRTIADAFRLFVGLTGLRRRDDGATAPSLLAQHHDASSSGS